jgi:IS1 family transposase
VESEDTDENNRLSENRDSEKGDPLMKAETRKTIESSIKENRSHLQKIERSKKLLKELFPTDEKTFKTFSDDEIEHIDQFIYRFSKMQDSMGMRLIPSLYSWLEGDTTPRPFLDILNRFEKLGIINSTDDWQFFRNLRNNLAHDYPESVA